MFGLNKRELEAKFTKSEMALLAWRSQEMSAALKASMGESSGMRKDAGATKGLPANMFNEEGELDLRGATAAQAYKYFQGIGMPIPAIKR